MYTTTNILRSSHVMVLSLLLFFCCHNLSCSWLILLNFELHDPWHCIKFVLVLSIVTIPYPFLSKNPKVGKWMFLLIVHGELIFYLILIGIYCNKFLRKILWEKCILLLFFWHQICQNGGKLKFLTFVYFSSNFKAFFYAKIIILMCY